MVIRGRTRGNGRQLANYLLTMAENSHIEILDVNGRGSMADAALIQELTSMSLTAELTKSQKGLYHAQINPAYGDDKKMTAAAWQQSADMLEKALGLSDQRRVIVLHTKKDRTHAHVVWERYDSKKGIMRSDSFSRYKQNAVRLEMEKLFEHKTTPEKNPHREDMKKELSALWQESPTGASFIKAAKEMGYTVATSPNRRPFMVVDRYGRSFDLVRQLENVKTKDVRERFKTEKLPTEKSALKSVQDNERLQRSQEKMSDQIDHQQEQRRLIGNEKKNKAAVSFAGNKSQLLDNETPDNKKETAQEFAENKPFKPKTMARELPEELSAIVANLSSEQQKQVIGLWLKQAKDMERYRENYAVQRVNLVAGNRAFGERKTIPTPEQQAEHLHTELINQAKAFEKENEEKAKKQEVAKGHEPGGTEKQKTVANDNGRETLKNEFKQNKVEAERNEGVGESQNKRTEEINRDHRTNANILSKEDKERIEKETLEKLKKMRENKSLNKGKGYER